MPGISASGGNRPSFAGLSAERGNAADQPARVGMQRIVEDCVGAAFLDDAAGIHDRDPVRHFGDGAHVVRDQHDGDAEFLLDVAHQVEDLRLHGDVERRRRLVGDQHARPARDRHGDHHALAHAAGQLVRIGARAPLRLGDADACAAARSPSGRPPPCSADWCSMIASAIWSPAVKTGLSDVIGSWKIIEMSAPRRLRSRFASAWVDVLAVEQDRAAGDAARRVGDKAHDRQRGDRLAAAGFADDPQRLARHQVETDAVERRHAARCAWRTRPSGRGSRAAALPFSARAASG